MPFSCFIVANVLIICNFICCVSYVNPQFTNFILPTKCNGNLFFKKWVIRYRLIWGLCFSEIGWLFFSGKDIINYLSLNIFLLTRSLSPEMTVFFHLVVVFFKLNHLTAIKKSVKYSRCQHLIIKNLCPLGGWLIGRNNHRAVLMQMIYQIPTSPLLVFGNSLLPFLIKLNVL